MKFGRRYFVILAALVVGFFAAGPASANVPMLPFFAFVRMSMWWVILLALLIETVALRYLFGMPWPRAVRLALIVNAISLLCGIVLYPLAGLLGYALLEDMIVDIFGATNLVEFSALLLGAAVVDTVVELFALWWIWSVRSSFMKGFGFLIANLASAGVLVAVMAWEAQIPEMPAEEVARVEAEYAAEIAFLRQTLEEFPAHVVVTEPGEGYHSPDRDWTQGILTEVETLRIRTMALSLPPTNVWIKGSTALLGVDARFREDDRTMDKGYFDTVLVGQYPRPTGSPHYRYRLERTLDGTVYAIQAVFRN